MLPSLSESGLGSIAPYLVTLLGGGLGGGLGGAILTHFFKKRQEGKDAKRIFLRSSVLALSPTPLPLANVKGVAVKLEYNGQQYDDLFVLEIELSNICDVHIKGLQIFIELPLTFNPLGEARIEPQPIQAMPVLESPKHGDNRSVSLSFPNLESNDSCRIILLGNGTPAGVRIYTRGVERLNVQAHYDPSLVGVIGKGVFMACLPFLGDVLDLYDAAFNSSNEKSKRKSL